MPLPFTENFDAYPQGIPPPDPPWKSVSGNWTVDTGALTPDASGSAVIECDADGSATWANYEILVKVMRTAGNIPHRFGVEIFVNPNGSYRFWIQDIISMALFKSGTQLTPYIAPLTPLETNVYFFIRLRAEWDGTATTIRVKMWKEGNVEPADWDIEYADANNSYYQGSVAFATYDTTNMFFDEVNVAVVSEAPPPPPPAKITTTIFTIVSNDKPEPDEIVHLWGQLSDFSSGIANKTVFMRIDGAIRNDISAITGDDGGLDLSTVIPLGSHTISAEFLGDDTYNPSSGAVFNITVAVKPPIPDAPIVQYPKTFDPRSNPNPFGQSNAHPTQIALDDAIDAGLTWLRIDFSWITSMPTSDAINWYRDDLVNYLKQRNTSVLMILCYGNPVFGMQDWNYPPTTPEQLDAWGKWIYEAVSHYKDRVQYWEVWNEPNTNGFWASGTNPIEYMNILRVAYENIKAADPTAKVVAGSFFGMPANPEDPNAYARILYQNGLKNYSDVISCHPYSGAYYIDHKWPWWSDYDFPNIVELRKLMTEFGDMNKPIWLSEYMVEVGWAYDSNVCDEVRQALILKQAWDYSQWVEKQLGTIEKLFFHTWDSVNGKLAEQTLRDMALKYNTAPLLPTSLEVHSFLDTTEITVQVQIVGIGSYATPFTVELNSGQYTLQCSYQTQQQTQVVTITSGQTTKINFNFSPAPTSVTLTIATGANGSVFPTGQVIMVIGQSYQFQATPDAVSTFDHWDLNGGNKGSSNPLTLTATADMDNKTLTGLFTANPPPQITLTIAVSGNGTTDITPGQHQFNIGDTVSITAITQAGSAFKQWQLDGLTYTTNPLSLPVTVDLNGKTLTAEFVPIAPIQAGFPIWTIPIGIAILIGGYLLNRRGKNRKG